MATGPDVAPRPLERRDLDQSARLRESHGFRRLSRHRGPEWRRPVAIPDFQSLMLPVLELAADGKEHTLAEVREILAQRFGLTDVDRAELLPSGRQRRFDNRVAWAKVHLAHAGLLFSKRRAVFEITKRGRDVLSEKPPRVDLNLLQRFEEFRRFRGIGRKTQAEEPADARGPSEAAETPEEMLEQAHQNIR